MSICRGHGFSKRNTQPEKGRIFVAAFRFICVEALLCVQISKSLPRFIHTFEEFSGSILIASYSWGPNVYCLCMERFSAYSFVYVKRTWVKALGVFL